jgi:hypothetical protein
MLRVSDVWERALHTPDPKERDRVVTLDLPEHLAELNEFPIAAEPNDPTAL